MSGSASPSTLSSEEGQQWEYKDCISCKVVGTGALALTGLYALRMARSQAPGTVFGKTMMAGIGFAFLAGGVVRWNMTPHRNARDVTDQFRHTTRQF
ncbi:hypothetical protein L210DRAFT_3560070 [Boletus edulis BED1]|uniref:Distal membrane-arm assembly complex protein 1-like domain-containing protein n=1 Tax=Boletus edulis BED1 TaxID=1328754 RepID=A0AAD4BIM1_BOLED|nr:hypothetical protein L210DRAFT_3560070 [Boletus edulis BED1]